MGSSSFEMLSRQGVGDGPQKCCHCGHFTLRGCLMFSAICILFSVGGTLLGVNTIGKSIAASAIGGAAITFHSIDVGSINSTDTLACQVVGVVSKPSPFNAKFYRTSATIKIPREADGDLIDVGTVWLPELHVGANEDLNLDMSVAFQVEHLDAFGRTGQQFVARDEVLMVIETSVNVFCWVLGILPIYLSRVPFSKTIRLEGMSGFSQSEHPILINRLVSTYGRPGILDVGVEVNIFNPSYLTAHVVSEMQLNVTHRGKRFGLARVADAHFHQGDNLIVANFSLYSNPDNSDAVEQFLQGFLHAEIQTLAMHGSKLSTVDPLLRVILDRLPLFFNFKAPSYQFFESIEASFDVRGLRAGARVFNPLMNHITFEHLAIEINEGSNAGNAVFKLDTNRSNTGIPGQVLQPNGTSLLKIRLSLSDAQLTSPQQVTRLLGGAMNGSILVGLNGPVSITVAPSFQMKFHYSADNVTCRLKCSVWCRQHGSPPNGAVDV